VRVLRFAPAAGAVTALRARATADPARRRAPNTTEDRTMPRTAIVNLKHHPDLQRALAHRKEFEGVVRADRRTAWGNPYGE